MANTTNFGWETPDDTDLVKDGAAAMRTLGNAIDASLVDLKGGTTGQILSKASNTDLDYTWINNDQGDITAVNAGVGITGGGTSGSVTITNAMADAITTKGDLLAGTAADTFARLGAGANGTVLTADSAETTGLKWVAQPTALAPFLVVPVTGNFVSRKYTWSGNASIPQNRVYYMPFYLPAATYDRILLRSATQQSGSATARLGLYNVGSDGRPSTVAFDAGTVAVNAADTTFSITINETLSAGYYYIAVASQSATTLWVKFGNSEGEPPSVRTGATFNHQYATVCFYQENVSGAFATAGTLVNTFDDFGVGVRFA